MTTDPTQTQDTTPALLADRSGFRWRGTTYPGFPDLPELSARDQRKVAVWATRYAPDRATAAQLRRAATQPPPPESVDRIHTAQAARDFLASPVGRRLWELLPTTARTRLRTPTTVVGATYPLSTSQLASLVNVSERQIGYWSTRGILPSFRDGRQRKFSINAAVIATWLATFDMQERKALARVAQEPDRFELVHLITYAMFDSSTTDHALEDDYVDAIRNTTDIVSRQRREA